MPRQSTLLLLSLFLLFVGVFQVARAEIVTLNSTAAEQCYTAEGCDFTDELIWTPRYPQSNDSVFIEGNATLFLNNVSVPIGSLELNNTASIILSSGATLSLLQTGYALVMDTDTTLQLENSTLNATGSIEASSVYSTNSLVITSGYQSIYTESVGSFFNAGNYFLASTVTLNSSAIDVTGQIVVDTLFSDGPSAFFGELRITTSATITNNPTLSLGTLFFEGAASISIYTSTASISSVMFNNASDSTVLTLNDGLYTVDLISSSNAFTLNVASANVTLGTGVFGTLILGQDAIFNVVQSPPIAPSTIGSVQTGAHTAIINIDSYVTISNEVNLNAYFNVTAQSSITFGDVATISVPSGFAIAGAGTVNLVGSLNAGAQNISIGTVQLGGGSLVVDTLSANSISVLTSNATIEGNVDLSNGGVSIGTYSLTVIGTYTQNSGVINVTLPETVNTIPFLTVNSTANIASAKVIANIVALKAGGVKYYIVHSNGALTTSTITAAALTPVSTVGALSTVVDANDLFLDVATKSAKKSIADEIKEHWKYAAIAAAAIVVIIIIIIVIVCMCKRRRHQYEKVPY